MGRISVRVQPGASRTEIKKEGNIIKIKLRSKPEKGKANKELIELLSRTLKVPKGSIKIVSGKTSRTKVIEIEGVLPEEIERRLFV